MKQRFPLGGLLIALSVLGPAPASAGGHSVRIILSATVLARVSIESQRLPSELRITPQDIERGYVDVDAVEIGVRSNHPAGVHIGFAAATAQFSSVDIDGKGPTVFVPQTRHGLQRQSVSVRLRLRLAPGAVPGTVAYPVRVSLTPM